MSSPGTEPDPRGHGESADHGRPTRGGRRRVIRKGTEQESVPGRSKDEQATGWSESGPEESTSDEEFLRDLPPHWS